MSQMVCGDAFLAAPSFEEWGRTVVGTGPYKLTSLQTKQSHRLEAFDDYWGDPAPAKSITFHVVAETAARVSGLLTGEYDFITEVTPDQFDLVEDGGKAHIEGGPVTLLRVILYNENHPALADPRIRQALSYAIDRELIAETIFGGLVGVPNGLQMKSFGPMYIEEHQGTSYDPEKARQLLAEAGYKGEELAYRYRHDFYTGEVQTAQILQSMWKAVGINVKLEMKEDVGQIIGPTAPPGLAILNLSNGVYWNDPIGQLWRLYQPGGVVQGRGTWENPEFDALGVELQSTDLATRRAAFAKMLEIYERTDPPGTYLHDLPLFYGVKSGVKWKAGQTSFMDFRAGHLSFD
jgi:peptide/nickel transport system substrate-binding protein